MAHEGASETILDFQPEWEKLGLDILAFIPEDHEWPGAPVKAVLKQGASARSGELVFRRFLLLCQTLAESSYDRFAIFEYDTLNLTNQLPGTHPLKLAAGFMITHGPDVPNNGKFFISLSPWILERCVLSRLIHAMCSALACKSPYERWIAGLLDRWLAVLFVEYDVPYEHIIKSLPFPFSHLDPLRFIENEKPAIVHGFKRKQDFGHLWPASS